MNHKRNLAFILLIAFIASSIVIAIPVSRAAEPTLESILDTVGFPLRTLVSTETFAAGMYRTTMYAEYAGYAYDNQLRWYPVTTSTFNLIFDGPDGVPQNTMGLVTPPLTKYFTASANFGLSLLSPDGTWYSETSRNIDGQKHAKIYQSQTDSNLYLIGFENMGAGSSSDFDYNDMVLSLERVQVQLTVVSAYDSPNPTSGPYTPGTSITASVTSPVAGPVGTLYVCTGWTGTGDVPGSGTGTTVPFTINQDSTITWNWKIQYYLTVNNGGHGTVSGENWYDANTPATFGITPTTVSDGTGVQYVFTGWSSSDAGGYTGSLTSTAVTMNNPITETAHWKTQYYLTVKTDPLGVATIPGQGWYDVSATPTLTAPFVSGTYCFYGWDVDGTSRGTANPINVLMGAPHTATAHYSNSAVGGEWAPINTAQVLTPWIAMAFLAIAFATAGSHRLLKKRW